MGSDFKVLVLPPDALTAAELGKSARVRDHRGWLEVVGAEWKSDAQGFSKRFLTTAVWWSMQTPMDQVWLFCFHEGLDVRELRFSAETEGWAVNRGVGMPFEDTTALALWLRRWRSKKTPLLPRDGVELLNAFIGKGPKKKKPAVKKKAAAKKKTAPKRKSAVRARRR
jgi:hypothetical protein